MCGLFGMVSYRKGSEEMPVKLIKALAKNSEIRGRDAGGVAYFDETQNYQLTVSRAEKAISTNGSLLEEVFKSPIIMGHTRQTTQGLASININNHPFPSVKGHFALAHNGVLTNDYTLRHELKLGKTKVMTDSYIVVQMLDVLHDGIINFMTLKDVAEQLQGTFTLTLVDDDKNLWIIRNNNPLCMVKITDLNAYIYTSTQDIMLDALSDFYECDITSYLMSRVGDKPYGEVITIGSGEIIKIDRFGHLTRGLFTPKVATTTLYNKWSNYDDEWAGYKWEYQTYWQNGIEYNYDGTICSKLPSKIKTIANKDLPFDPKRGEGCDTLIHGVYGMFAPVKRVVIHNREELEVVGEPWKTSGGLIASVYSMFLGKSLPETNYEKMLSLTIEDLLKPVKLSSLYSILRTKADGHNKPRRICLTDYKKWVTSLLCWRGLEKRLSLDGFGDNKAGRDFMQVIQTFLLLNWVYKTQCAYVVENGCLKNSLYKIAYTFFDVEIEKLLEIKQTKGIYEYCQGLSIFYLNQMTK